MTCSTVMPLPLHQRTTQPQHALVPPHGCCPVVFISDPPLGIPLQTTQYNRTATVTTNRVLDIARL
jgi:hypothetical protein